MHSAIKNIVRMCLPQSFRFLIWRLIPKVILFNTYCLKISKPIKDLSPLSDEFIVNGKINIKVLKWEDEETLRNACKYRGANHFKKKISNRLDSPEWECLALFDKNNGDIAYFSWVINKSIPYFEEFGITLEAGQFLIKDVYVIPHYRHRGINTRMEQERTNYCIRKGAKEIFAQLPDDNKRGIELYLNLGYNLHQQNYLIWWPMFNVFRSLSAFIKTPFKMVVK